MRLSPLSGWPGNCPAAVDMPKSHSRQRAPPAGDFLAAAMQLDGDSAADPYQAYYDNCHFYWA